MTAADLCCAEVDGNRITYREAGRGAPLVLLHGFLCDSRCWRCQLSGLSDAFRVVAWDAPGAGASSDPPEGFTTASYARSLGSFLDAIGIGDAHVVGLSWGGILAQEFYRMYPSRVRRLVLADTYAGWRGSLAVPVWKERLAACLRDASAPASAIVAKFLPGMFTDTASKEVREELSAVISDFHPVGFRLMSMSSAETDTRDLLPAIDVPTLLLWGDDDRRSPMHVATQFRAAITGAELVVIAGAGHMSNMEQPDAFNDYVRRFCSKRVDIASKLIRASASAIYKAFATPEALETWLPPQGMTGSMVRFSFREGGTYRMRLAYNEPRHTPGKTSDDADEVEVRFVKLVPAKRIEQVVTFNSDDPAFAGEMRITWLLEPAQDGTWVRVRCEDVPVGIRPEDHQAGLKSTLENLAVFAESARC